MLKEDTFGPDLPSSVTDACALKGQNAASDLSVNVASVLYPPTPSHSAQSDVVNIGKSLDAVSLSNSTEVVNSDTKKESTESGPVVVTDIKVASLHSTTGESRCRIIVRMKEARTLDAFQTFFAFFKKTVLTKIKH